MLFSLRAELLQLHPRRDYTFAGLDNWIRAFTKDEFFWPSVWRTVLYTCRGGAAERLGALGTAMLLNQGLRVTTSTGPSSSCRTWCRSIAAIYVWLWLLNGQFGLVNELLFQIGYYLTGKGIVGPN